MKDIFKLLKLVSNPGQYINSEYNSLTDTIISKWQKKDVVKVCLCFPDKYVIGMSNIGIEIIYKLLNSLDNALCERVFAPEQDMEELLNRTNAELFSLETQHKVSDFDIIGFSLQHELCYTNIFTILSLARIPFRRKERTSVFPLIIAGGHCCCNPSVLSEYIDFFVIGDAEDFLPKLVDLILQYKIKAIHNISISKSELLNEIDKFKETFVPENKGKQVTPAVVDIRQSFYPTRPTVPIIKTTHLRLNLELTRGCGYNCNFCQATYTHRPLRYRDKEHVKYLIEEGINSTGYDEIALTGYCVTNYPYLLEIIEFIHKRYDKNYVSISLPSLRIEDIDERLVESLSYPRRSTITIAPETATEGLRKVLNKNISNNELFKKIKILYKYGFRRIKLYFMVGLPTETHEDIEAIPTLIKELKKYFPFMKFNVAISIFVPKPHTPFQFARMDSYENLCSKLNFLSKHLKKEFSVDSIKNRIYSSFIEALISRGDEKVGSLIEKVWLRGARFDNWNENFKVDLWIEEIINNNIELEKYLFSKLSESTKFAWGNILYNDSFSKLYERYVNATEQRNEKQPTKLPYLQENINETINNYRFIIQYSNSRLNKFYEKYTLRLRFSRKGKVRFISYLDQMEIIKRTLRMADLPLSYTQGFNPQVKISYAPPTSIGYESESEYIDVEITNLIDIKKVMNIDKFLPKGFNLLNAKILMSELSKIPSLNSSVNLIEYIIKYEDKFENEKIEKFLSEKEIIIEKLKKKSMDKINLKELVKVVKIIDSHTLLLLLQFGPHRSLKPEIVVGKIFDIPDDKFYKFDILRKNLYIETPNGNILELI